MSAQAARPADQDQRDAAVRERERNVVMEAGAGTGKTSTLVRRLVELVAPARDAPPLSMSRIAATTFTRRAAGELSLRIREELLKGLTGAATSTEQLALLRQALGELDTAYVGTIHSFADRLLRMKPAESSLSPSYEVVEDEEELADEAYQLLLRGAKQGTLANSLAGTGAEASGRAAAGGVRGGQGRGLVCRGAGTGGRAPGERRRTGARAGGEVGRRGQGNREAWFRPVWVSRAVQEATREEEEENDPRWHDREGRYGRFYGTVVHRAMERCVRNRDLAAAEAVERAVEEAAARMHQGEAMEEARLREHRGEAVQDVQRGLAALEREGLRAEAGAMLQPEYPISGPDGQGEVLLGYVDLVRAGEDGVVVIDYKTDWPPPGAVEQAMPEYVEQVRAYGRLLVQAAVASEGVVRCGLLYTADGSVWWVT